MYKASVIIPTFNRPQELHDCIQSIFKQTVKPYELIIVDDGDLSEIPIEDECKDAGIHFIYHKKDLPGLTESRNAGISLSHGDIIFFFDDDVVLSPTFLEEIIKVYDSDVMEMVGGVGGMITNLKPLNLSRRIRKLFEIIFLISGIREGKVLRSGFFTNLFESKFPIRGIKEVDFLPGGAMSFRKEIFQEFSFTDRYRSYGFGEDKDFSYQVSKKYSLLLNRAAKLIHIESPKMRPDKKTYGKKIVLGRYLFFRDHVKKNWWDWVFFYYSVFGYFIIRLIISIVSPGRDNSAHLTGIFSAIRDIIAGRVM